MICRIKRTRSRRRGPWRSRQYRLFVASQPCLITGRAAQCCHLTHNGTASKGPDYETVPLAPHIHDQLDRRAKLPNGEWGREAVEKFYRVDLLAHARRIYAGWLQRKGAAA